MKTIGTAKQTVWKYCIKLLCEAEHCVKKNILENKQTGWQFGMRTRRQEIMTEVTAGEDIKKTGSGVQQEHKLQRCKHDGQVCKITLLEL